MVEQREKQDRDRTGDLRSVDSPDEGADGNLDENPPAREERDERAEVLPEPDGDRRDAAGHDDDERGPAVQEAGERAEGLLEEVVDPAGPRKEDSQLGVAQGAGEREEPPEQPDQKDQARVRQGLRDVARRQEDPRPDDRADRQERPVPRPEPPLEAGASLFGPRHSAARKRVRSRWKWWTPASCVGE